MSYANLVAQAITGGGSEMFLRFRDFLCSQDATDGTYDYSSSGIGWTMHDEDYDTDKDTLTNGDWFVAYSPGESGDDDIYIQFVYSTASAWLGIRTWFYWNATTHAGLVGSANAVSGTGNTTHDDELWIYGDLDAVLHISFGTAYYGSWCGRTINPLYDDTVATSSSSITAASPATITVDAVPSSWFVGQTLWLLDTATAQQIDIISIPNGTSITANVTTTMLAGCKLRADHLIANSNSTQWSAAYGILAHDGSQGGTTTYVTFSEPFSTIQTTQQPDQLNDDYVAGPVVMHDTAPDGYYGEMPNVLSVSGTGRTDEEILVDNDGQEYRYFEIYSAKHVLLKEV